VNDTTCKPYTYLLANSIHRMGLTLCSELDHSRFRLMTFRILLAPDLMQASQLRWRKSCFPLSGGGLSLSKFSTSSPLSNP